MHAGLSNKGMTSEIAALDFIQSQQVQVNQSPGRVVNNKPFRS